ncbi:MAG TPA: hypothetical protein VN937_16860 [Blastocatellia bacterium]|nr:hypothetical protein [Blastocatellia bacterium]
MSNYVPFITSSKTLRLVKSIYHDADTARLSIDVAERLTLPDSLKLWIDPGVDGLDDLERRRPRPDSKDTDKEKTSAWYEFMKSIPGFESIGDPSFWLKPDKGETKRFVTKVLDRCAKHQPTWITVPQLPIVEGSSRNRINRVLAKETGNWKRSRSFSGRFILPLIFTNQNQINGKTQRNPKVEQAERCYHESQAEGLWVVDASLTDDSGSRTLRNTRFPGIIALHQELNNKIPSKIRIAGPYWGLNLVLWARGLVDHPLIGIGGNYQYHLAGGPSRKSNTRVAISSLRRRVGIAQLDSWLVGALKVLGPAHPARGEFERVLKQFSLLSDEDNARQQVARFYKTWVDLIATNPTLGRSMALFQDLSTAYALGKSLPDFAKTEETARKPESVAEPLMLNCL